MTWTWSTPVTTDSDNTTYTTNFEISGANFYATIVGGPAFGDTELESFIAALDALPFVTSIYVDKRVNDKTENASLYQFVEPPVEP